MGVTIVVPTLGTRPDWLRLSLSALRRQRVHANIVLVGPHSDVLHNAALEFGATHILEKGRSLSAAINQGIRENPDPTPFVGWIADDDVIAPNSLGQSLDALKKNPDAPFAFGRIRYIDANGKSMWLLRPGSWSVRYAKYGRNFIPQPGSVQRLSAWEAVGGLDETLSNAMDLDLFLKMARLGKPAYVSSELASFRVHDGSISVIKNGQSNADEARRVANRYRDEENLNGIIAAAVHVSDRFFLSAHRRIPGPSAPRVGAVPYYVVDAITPGSQS